MGFFPSTTSSINNLDHSFDSSTKSYKSYGVSNVVSFNDIQLKDICSKEKYIHLINTTKRLIDITAWRLCAFVDGVEMLDYTFKTNIFMWPNQEIKVFL